MMEPIKTLAKSLPVKVDVENPLKSSSSRTSSSNYSTSIEINVDSHLDNKTVHSEKHRKSSKQLRNERHAYERYLDTFVRIEDRRYLPNGSVRRQLAPLRAMVGTVVLSPSKFRHKHFRPLGSHFYFSEHIMAVDPLVSAISERERLNTTKTISTIIFVSTRDSKGFSVSGYIDLEQSMRRFKLGEFKCHPWSDIFAGRRRLEPNNQDLSFVTWKNATVYYNESDNYRIIPDAGKGLCFLFKGDGSLLPIEKFITEEHSSCTFLESEKHGFCAVYDHRIRRKM
ncbi:cilia- and flagella-associated protein 299 [Drosophila bipectinata]|uniref:cilia- and flagella-associated protein 299 n=1 Tax=Drosophila bipectinata TaxID=42026 RepID=UPI001C8A2DF8|nr:cilia- and flagella-associated protein 299 isoform X2 [Drosophila bipectinata]